MPFVLMVLFAIALLVTCAGLFLSPRSQPRRPQNEYLITSRGRRIVDEAPPIPVRAGRLSTEERAAVVRRRARVNSVGAYAMGRSVGISPSGVKVLTPGLWDQFVDRAGSWKVAVPGLIAIFVLGLYLFSLAFPHSAIWTFASFGQPASAPTTTSSRPAYAASQHLARLSQLDPAQYQSTQEYDTWAYSACSSASLTEVINAYGHKYRITDVLKIESGLHEITPQLGLLEDVGIQRTAAKFGFDTAWGYKLSLDQVIAAANRGTPVIVSFPPARYPGGHLLVVRGGDSNNVYLADSSLYNRTQLSRQRFMQLWGGFSAILTPV